jgi:uncharacterized protein YbbK (DUF523 family)
MDQSKNSPQLLVSACLAGLHTQWNGESGQVDRIVDLVRSGRALLLCPEQLGGLPTPREPAEIEPGKTAADVLAGRARVVSLSGRDVTAQFVRGATEALALCQMAGIQVAILKAWSPSCGSRQTYDGTHSNTLRPGRGIAAELLAQNGIQVYSEETWQDP